MLQGEHSAILSTFIKLSFVIKIFVLSIFEWPFYTGFTIDYDRAHTGKVIQNSSSLIYSPTYRKDLNLLEMSYSQFMRILYLTHMPKII